MDPGSYKCVTSPLQGDSDWVVGSGCLVPPSTVGSNDEDDEDGSPRSWDEGDLTTGMSPPTQPTGATELNGIVQWAMGGTQHESWLPCGTASIASFLRGWLGMVIRYPVT